MSQYPAAWGLSSASPFCIKLETFLRMTHIPFETIPDATFKRAPKGKVPYVVVGGLAIGDSGLIIDWLNQEHRVQLDSMLTVEEQAVGRAMLRLIEEHLYWVLVYSRWADDEGFGVLKREVFKGLPPIASFVIPRVARREVLANLRAVGIGRHSRDEVYGMGRDDLSALSDFLSDKPFFFGDRPSTLDASAYGLVTSVLKTPIESPMKRDVQSMPNLVEFCGRVDEWIHSEENDADRG